MLNLSTSTIKQAIQLTDAYIDTKNDIAIHYTKLDTQFITDKPKPTTKINILANDAINQIKQFAQENIRDLEQQRTYLHLKQELQHTQIRTAHIAQENPQPQEEIDYLNINQPMPTLSPEYAIPNLNTQQPTHTSNYQFE